jgi:nucleoid-associated protein YgaU
MSASDAGGELVKARIQVLDDDLRPVDVIPVLFNPAEYTLSRRSRYAEQEFSGTERAVTQFVGRDPEKLSMELFFDTSEGGGDVREHTQRVGDLLSVDSALGAPPRCRFVWGSLVFTAVLERAETRFTMFQPDGVPVRARQAVTFREYRAPGGTEEDPPMVAAASSKVREARDGDSLWVMAAEEYGDAREWRRIADANGISDPEDLSPGEELEVPPLDR